MARLAVFSPSVLIVSFALALGVSACQAGPPPATPTTPPATPAASAGPTAPAAATTAGSRCDAAQARIAREADQRATQAAGGQDFSRHLAAHFSDHKVSWLMREDLFQKYIVDAKATKFGRCEGGSCYLFVAPRATIRKAIGDSMKNGKHDPALLGAALGLPPKSFEGPLRLMTLDLDAAAVCARLPVDTDPGVWKCKGPEDRDCFKFGGYTSGGVPEAMIVDAPVETTQTEQIP